MSLPQEHDYIGLSEPLHAEKVSEIEGKKVYNFGETELRLGLPGLETLEKKAGFGASLSGKDLKDESLKNFVSGAKRGFSDAINGSGKWGLSINGDSQVQNNAFSKTNNISVKDKPVEEKNNEPGNNTPASKAQVIGWPPIRSFRKNTLATNSPKNGDDTGKSGSSCLYVKVSMDGAPYLRKIDLKTYCSYAELSSALEKMFSCFTIGQYGQGLAEKEHLSESRLIYLLRGTEYVLTYEDKDDDWMLVGDVPWEMFTDSCKRLRIMKGSDAIGLAPRTMQKCKSQN